MEPFSYHEVREALVFPTKNPKFIQASDGINLAYYPYLAAQDSILIFYHGGGTWSSGLYQHMADALCRVHNISTYLIDIRGHGNSGGPRGDAPNMEQVWQDIDSIITFVKTKHPGASIYLGGHSSGAGLVLNYSNWKKRLTVAGYIFITPFLGSNSQAIREHSGTCLSVVKKVKVWAFILNVLSGGYLCKHTPTVFFNYSTKHKKETPHTLDYYTAAMAMAVFPHDAQAIFAKLTKPFLLTIGERDEQFLPEKVIGFKTDAINVKNKSVAQIVTQATHLSILLESVNLISDFIHRGQ